jgi:hypothetical protein
MVYPIAEPLKIRNITKSNAYQYAIAKGLQLDIHSYMKKFFQFQLIGQPLEVGHIEELCKRCPSGLFASGDFSAATDNVKIELTKLFFERILHRLLHLRVVSMRHCDILRRVLYEHEIHYPTGYGEDLEPVIQKNGQLMGSVLSFPVLCAINLATYWYSLDLYNDSKNIPRIEHFDQLNVMINGDDILFRTEKEHYQQWLECLPEAGLFPSAGKNFFHPKYATVNSELFSIHGNVVKQIPFFNVGMLLGQSKVCRSETKQKPVHCLHRDVIEGAIQKERADERFCYYNREKLNKSSKSADGHQMNYYLPRELGGLGMVKPNATFISSECANRIGEEGRRALGSTVIVNGVQRRIAKYLYDKWTTPYLKPPMKPIGQEIDLDREDNMFRDIPDDDYKILVPDKWCPMPSYCREKVSQHHDPNWSSPPMDSAELERLKFEAKGVRAYRSARLGIPCHEALQLRGFTEYKWIGDQSQVPVQIQEIACC